MFLYPRSAIINNSLIDCTLHSHVEVLKLWHPAVHAAAIQGDLSKCYGIPTVSLRIIKSSVYKLISPPCADWKLKQLMSRGLPERSLSLKLKCEFSNIISRLVTKMSHKVHALSRSKQVQKVSRTSPAVNQ